MLEIQKCIFLKRIFERLQIWWKSISILNWVELCVYSKFKTLLYLKSPVHIFKKYVSFCRVVLNPNVLLCLKSPSTSPSNVIKHLNMSLGISVHKRTHIRWEGGLIYIPYPAFYIVTYMCFVTILSNISVQTHHTHMRAFCSWNPGTAVWGIWVSNSTAPRLLLSDLDCPPPVENGSNTKTNTQIQICVGSKHMFESHIYVPQS